MVSHFDKLNTEKDDVNVIAHNSEKLICFELKQMTFKDSFSFLSSSLYKLVKLTKKKEVIRGTTGTNTLQTRN